MSHTIISVFVVLASQILPFFGIEVGNEALTTTITTLATIGAAVWIWVRRVQAGDVTVSGKRV